MNDCSKETSLVYLDHAATTPLNPNIVQGHENLVEDFFFNPHSTHQHSENCLRAIENAKVKLLKILGIDRDEADVVWTSGGTEANNLAILGNLREMQCGQCTAMVEKSAHQSMLAPAQANIDECGRCLEVPVDGKGHLSLDTLAVKDLPAEGGVLAVCHVNNETGARQDLVAARSWLDKNAPDVYLVVDAVQSFTKIDIEWSEARIDLLVLGGRKIGAPPSTGALVMRKGTPLKPIMFGGGQQKGYRPGTMDTVGIIEFAAAAEDAWNGKDRCYHHAAMLRERLWHTLHACSPVEPIVLSPDDSSPYICNVALPGYEGAIVMRALAEKGIIVATGSACSAESSSTSHVLEAMKVDRRLARNALRISFSGINQKADIDNLGKALAEVLENY